MVIAKSGQWISQKRHPVQLSISSIYGTPVSSDLMIFLTHNAVQIPQDLHQFLKKITLYSFFSFFLVCDDLAAVVPFLRFGVGLVLVSLTILLTAFVVKI